MNYCWCIHQVVRPLTMFIVRPHSAVQAWTWYRCAVSVIWSASLANLIFVNYDHSKFTIHVLLLDVKCTSCWTYLILISHSVAPIVCVHSKEISALNSTRIPLISDFEPVSDYIFFQCTVKAVTESLMKEKPQNCSIDNKNGNSMPICHIIMWPVVFLIHKMCDLIMIIGCFPAGRCVKGFESSETFTIYRLSI